MKTETLFRYYETERDLINYLVSCGLERQIALRQLAHEREHARKAVELGYKDIKWGWRAVCEKNTGKVLEFKYLVKVEDITPEDAIKIAQVPEKPSSLDKRVTETAEIIQALDEMGIPK